MCLIIFLILAIAPVHGSTQEFTGSGDIMGDGTTFSLDIDHERLKNHLKCTSCLEQCDQIRKSAMSYYFCMVCLEDCGSNRDALLHYFVTRKCEFIPEAKHQEILLPTEVLGGTWWKPEGEEAPTRVADDRELKQKYEEAKSHLGQCVQALSSCESTPFSSHTETNQVPNATEEPVISTEEEQIQSIINKYSSYFTRSEDVRDILNTPLDQLAPQKMAIILKSTAAKQQSAGKWACTSTKEAVTPFKAKHVSGKYTVTVLQTPEYSQIYYKGSCSSKVPDPSIKISNAICKTDDNFHKSIIYVTAEQYQDKTANFINCDPIGQYYLCDDWISLPGQCNLFITS